MREASSAERLREGVVHSSSSSLPSKGGELGRGSSLSLPRVSETELAASMTQDFSSFNIHSYEFLFHLPQSEFL